MALFLVLPFETTPYKGRHKKTRPFLRGRRGQADLHLAALAVPRAAPKPRDGDGNGHHGPRTNKKQHTSSCGILVFWYVGICCFLANFGVFGEFWCFGVFSILCSLVCCGALVFYPLPCGMCAKIILCDPSLMVCCHFPRSPSWVGLGAGCRRVPGSLPGVSVATLGNSIGCCLRCPLSGSVPEMVCFCCSCQLLLGLTFLESFS